MFDSRGLTSTGAAPPAGAPPPAAPKAGRVGDSNTHLFDRAAIIIKHWKAAAALAILVVAAMMYQTYTTVPLYRAQARIQIDEEQTTAQTDFKEPYLAYSDPEPYYQTQYKILQGRDLALRAVRHLKLDSVPEFNGQGPKPPALAQLLSAVKAKVTAPFRNDPGTPQRHQAAPENEQADAFLGRVGGNPDRGSS